ISQAEDGIRDRNVTGVQTCALPIFLPLSGAARGVIPWVKIHYSVTALQIFFGESEFASSSGSKSRHRLVELHGVCHEASKYCVRSEERGVGKEWGGKWGQRPRR